MSDKLVDFTYINSIARGNNQFKAEMIELFKRDALDNINRLTKLITDNNWEEAQNLCHKMKSSYAYFGVSKLQESMATMEANCAERKCDVANMLAVMKNTSQLTTIILTELNEELTRIKA